MYRPVGEIDELEVPETLHALIAARLDGLSAEERRAARRTAPCSARPSHATAWRRCAGRAEAELEPSARRRSSARRCSRSRPTHARPSTASTASSRTSSGMSPTRRSRGATGAPVISPRPRTSPTALGRGRGHRGRRVAPTSTRYEAAPDADDAPRSGSGRARRSPAPASAPRSLAAAAEAQRYFEQAAELTDDPLEQALCSTAPARWPGAPTAGRGRARSSSTRTTCSSESGRRRGGRSVSARLGEIDFTEGHPQRRSRGSSRPWRHSRTRSRTRTSPSSPVSSAASSSSAERARRRRRISNRRSAWPRPSISPRRWSRR